MHERRVQLEASDLSKRYGPRLLFRDLSLSLTAGDTVAIVGPNGSGKSTLLRMLGGLLAPTNGQVTLQVDGAPVPAADHPLHVGIVAPYVNLYEPLTARENLQFIAKLRRLSDAPARIMRVLGEVGLAERADDTVATFSSGMIQRLRIAAALLPDPDVLLLDEPSITLDAAGSDVLARLIDRAGSSGHIVLVATNVPAEAARCAAACDVTHFR